MKTVDATVLVHDGPMAKAYLAALLTHGWRPGQIVLLVFDTQKKSGKPIGGFLPGRLRTGYCRFRQDVSNNFWPRYLYGTRDLLVAAMARALSALDPRAEEILRFVAGKSPYRDCADRLEVLRISGWKDEALAACLRQAGTSTILYTGGGIVPAGLLGAAGAEFLHIHPAILPAVRGADVLLWSTLLGRPPGATAFYLRPGIDTGPVVAQREFPFPRFEPAGEKRPTDALLYRAVYSFYDPLVRSTLLRELVERCAGRLGSLDARDQNLADGTTFHFMHDELRKKALARIFP